MARPVDVAQYIYDSMGEWIDAWKLQKLTYYSKAWSLAWDGDPIFEEEFEAWTDGPVSRSLHNVIKHHMPRSSTQLPFANPDALTTRQKAVISAVLKFYGELDKNALIALTLDEEPWQEARVGLKPEDRGKPMIKDETIRQTYTRQALLKNEVPKAPGGHDLSSVQVTDETIAEQIDKWSETLDWLRLN